MTKSKHIQQRMSQRGIKQSMIKLVLDFGISSGDKIILNKKGVDNVLIELEELKKKIISGNHIVAIM